MLTIEDIRNPARKSGFNFVNSASPSRVKNSNDRTTPIWRAAAGAKQSPTSWRGPSRKSQEAAAQDYCDYKNGVTHMLTIEDIRNPARKSGFDYVNLVGGTSGGGGRTYWRAASGTKQAPGSWRGTSRKSQEGAAQDYCDYKNGLATVTLPSYPAPIIDMGNTKRHAPKAEKITVKREKFRGPHDLYDVLILTPNGATVCRKVGITAKGHGRYFDICRTFGLSIKPLAKAKTYPSEAKAIIAEDAKIAEVAKSKDWRRVGKEAFAPIKETV